MPLPTTTCGACGAEKVPTPTERTYQDGVLCDITYVMAHPYAMSAALDRCAGSHAVLAVQPVDPQPDDPLPPA